MTDMILMDKIASLEAELSALKENAPVEYDLRLDAMRPVTADEYRVLVGKFHTARGRSEMFRIGEVPHRLVQDNIVRPEEIVGWEYRASTDCYHRVTVDPVPDPMTDDVKAAIAAVINPATTSKPLPSNALERSAQDIGLRVP